MSARVNKAGKVVKQLKSVVERKRGRPTGKNRTPLSEDEKKSRNAQYERERRAEYAAAIADLADALGADQAVPNPELLAQAISFIQGMSSRSTDNNDDLKRTNQALLTQVQMLENAIDTALQQ